MNAASAPAKVFTIPAGENFLQRLAQQLLAEVDGDFLKLSDYRIFLPTRRACRALADSFLSLVDGRAAVLPRLQPLGGFDEDDPAASVFDDLDATLPPPIAPLQRQLLLAQLIMRKDASLNLDRALQLAVALAEFFDQLQREECDTTTLQQIVPDQFAQHWQEVLQFLEIVTQRWPEILAARNLSDPMRYRIAQLRAQARAWEQQSPTAPVIAAGSTGSMPATAELLRVIAHLPQGRVILPGLDQELDETGWQAVDALHGQHHLKQLIEKIGVTRTQVTVWPTCTPAINQRRHLLSAALRPATTTDSWRELSPKQIDVPTACQNMATVTAASIQEEAMVVALAVRAALANGDHSIAVVTPDRVLAERVQVALRRWQITANDTAGQPLSQQPLGSFMRLVLTACAETAGAIDYLALLKHPLMAGGVSAPQCRHFAREAERLIWRGPKLGGGLGNSILELRDKNAATPLVDFFVGLETTLAPLQQQLQQPADLDALLRAHIVVCETLATTDQTPGTEILWRGDVGMAAVDWLQALLAALIDFPQQPGSVYSPMFHHLLEQVMVRPARTEHPRVQIMGLLEARLLYADKVILAGLNENIWPPAVPLDPWLSRPMRQQIGLPAPEVRVGLAAHDFMQLAALPDVLLTRAERDATAPTVPSRFLLRVETVLQALKQDKNILAQDQYWLGLARALDRPEKIIPIDRPMPKPAAVVRPRRLSVTDIELLRCNPYGYYAKKILGLRALEPIDADPTAADKGTFIHRIFYEFMRDHPAGVTDVSAAEKYLLQRGQEFYQSNKNHPTVEAFWWPRYQALVQSFVAKQTFWQRDHQWLGGESDGCHKLKVADLTWEIHGKPDRIDRLADGRLVISDYKTGSIPSRDMVDYGFAPQLALLGWLAEQGAYGDPSTTIAALHYWHLRAGGAGKDQSRIYSAEPTRELIEAAAAGLVQLLARFGDSAQPYQVRPVPKFYPRYDDYAHLARIAEWSAGDRDSSEAA